MRPRALLLSCLVTLAFGVEELRGDGVWGKPPFHEDLRYEWKLKGFAGALIGIFYPSSGEASLSSRADGNTEAVTTVLEVTSPKRGPEEYYRYGAETDLASRPSRVWSSYNFKGRSKDRGADVDAADVREFASGIQFLRMEHPAAPVEMRLWSADRQYPVRALPMGTEWVDVAGERFEADRFAIEGMKKKGERRFKARFEVWLLDDEASTPVRIVADRGPLRIQLDLASSSADAPARPDAP